MRQNERSLIQGPTSGLSDVEMAFLGSPAATERVLKAVPELGQRSPSGLSKMEWAQMGLKSARKVVKSAYDVKQD